MSYEVWHRKDALTTEVVRRTKSLKDAVLFFNECYEGEVLIYDVLLDSIVLRKKPKAPPSLWDRFLNLFE